MKIILVGYGKMGRMIEQLALQAGHTVVKSVDIQNLDDLRSIEKIADVIMEFSSSSALSPLCEYVKRTGTALLSGTTSYSAEDIKVFNELGNFAPVLHSANYSLGIAVFKQLLKQISPTLLGSFDVEITETHHNQKADAPSGTAKLLYEAIDPTHEYTPVYGREGLCGKRGTKEIGVHALRGGTVAGTHTVSFFGQDEELSITHRASSRAIFASGAIKAAESLITMPKGAYTLDQVLFGE